VWAQVDFATGVIRLEPGTTKNAEGRTFPFALLPELAALLQGQRAKTHRLEREQERIIPVVFHVGGHPIWSKRFYRQWWKAVKAAAVYREWTDPRTGKAKSTGHRFKSDGRLQLFNHLPSSDASPPIPLPGGLAALESGHPGNAPTGLTTDRGEGRNQPTATTGRCPVGWPGYCAQPSDRWCPVGTGGRRSLIHHGARRP